MPSSLIVEYLNVFEQALPRFSSAPVTFMIYMLSLQCAKEALSNRIVQAFACKK